MKLLVSLILLLVVISLNFHTILCLQPGECGDASDIDCDVEALLAFKDTVTRGADLFRSWDSADRDPCGWRYVTCSQVDVGRERVTLLDINFYNDPEEYTVTATLVPDFSKLRFVRELKVGGQNITGSLPKQYSVLDRIADFWAFKLELTGTLPPEYSVWRLIQQFTSNTNKLTGTLPPHYSAWKFVDEFGTSRNSLTSSIPVEYSEWVDMLQFSVWENRLSGTLPVEYSVWRRVEEFWVSTNRFLSGSLPAEYSTMKSMTSWFSSDTDILPCIPEEWSTWSDSITLEV